MRSLVISIALLVPSTLSACTITELTTPVADAGTPTGDGQPSTGVLGFTPSNLGNALASVDTSKLIDIDAKNNPDTLSVECGSQANDGCVIMTVTQSDGTQVDVYFARSWRIEPNAIVAAGGTKPVVLVALTTIDILGRLDGSAANITATTGGIKGATTAGGGKGGGALGKTTNDTAGIGGGGGGFCGPGGAGGNAAGGSGTGGVTYANPQLVPLVAGSAGGGGATFGGGSGGAIQLVAGTSITIESGGVVSVGGGGGDPGGAYSAGQAAGGGGSGGALLLESPSVTVSGTLEANGGGGGGGGPGSMYGADATPNAQAAAGGSPSTNGAGGIGGAGMTAGGGAGAMGDAPAAGNFVAGGGGGGAGYIRINTKTASATLSGTLSPAVGTTCVSQGPLG